jgi:hypothetical protein
MIFLPFETVAKMKRPFYALFDVRLVPADAFPRRGFFGMKAVPLPRCPMFWFSSITTLFSLA